MHTRNTDILILGAGGAGLFAAQIQDTAMARRNAILTAIGAAD